MLRNTFLRRGKVAVQTTLIVAVLLGVRFAVAEADWEFVTPGPLLSAVVSGGIFVVALVVAGTLSDYKESERVPAEMIGALSSILTDARAWKKEKPAFDLAGLERRVQTVVTTFKSDLQNPGARDCLDAVNALSESFADMDRSEIIATYISRLRGEQSALRKVVLRAYHIQETNFVPSAYVLIWVILLLAVGVLTFTESESNVEAYVLLGALYFFLFYLARLLKILDTPFRPGSRSWDDVDFQLIDEFSERLGGAPSMDGAAGIRWDARQFATDVAAELARLSEQQPKS